MLAHPQRTPSVHAPSLLLLIPGAGYMLAGSVAHDVAAGWIGAVLMLITTGGVAWVRWSLKRAVDDRVDSAIEERLTELGLLDRHHRR